MNNTQLEKIGVPAECFRMAVLCIAEATKSKTIKGRTEVKKAVEKVVQNAEGHLSDPHFGRLASAIIEARNFTLPDPITYRTWGEDIDEASHVQMQNVCKLPVARRAALMPDAHVGYGLPIGGVLACENAVIPYAVGVDIACRMKLSVFDLPVETLDNKPHLFQNALENGTRFGVGNEWEKRQNHSVMDQDWNVTRVTKDNKDRAWKQLGTSGSGNHFVEFGVYTKGEESHLALMSHSGSRGTGAAVCSLYHHLAQRALPARYKDFNYLAWLDMDSQEGQEYWAAMNLMGDYAAANHAVIHKVIADLVGAEVIESIENHHNFAWKEVHGGKELIVHRKGATPAGVGQLGVIPGSMATPAYVVRGLGNPDSLTSASHGAGRVMSRTAARNKYTWNAVKADLAKKGVTVLSAGADEVPYVYKDIDSVMAAQGDLVKVCARFDPRIVKMSDDAKAED